MRKGILLAGGSGTRLHPITKVISKQLLPIYDKPMVYYPLSVLMLANIREILIISTPYDIELYKSLLGCGKQFGIQLSYSIQEKPAGIAQAFIIGKKFIKNDAACLILGDNIFWGQGFSDILGNANKKRAGATVFGYKVQKPESYGIAEFDTNNKVVSIEEKPKFPKSDIAVTGLYFYDNQVIEIAENIRPSKRGELEITSVNNAYIEQEKLSIEILGRGFAWLDTGTSEGLLDASNFVATVEKRQGFKVGCLEEIAYNKKWISREFIINSFNRNNNSTYYNYIKSIIDTE